MKKAAKLYQNFVQKHRGQGPKDEAEFKQHLDGISKDDLKGMGIDDIEKAMTSPRDGQKYGVVFGVSMTQAMGPPEKDRVPGNEKTMGKTPPTTRTGPAVILYEKTGVGGKRYVAYAMGGSVVEVDDAKFKELVPTAQ